MRWDNLFDDLESQLEHELGVESIDMRAEEERLRLGRLSIRDRLTTMIVVEDAHWNTPDDAAADTIRLMISSGVMLTVRPSIFGKDWLAGELIEESHRQSQCVLALDAITSILPTPRQLSRSLRQAPITTSPDRLTDRLGMAFVLRDLCRRRASVEVATPVGTLFGTIDRVGRDHLDLAVHEPGSVRRETNVSHYRIIPVAQILFVRL